MQNPAHIPSPAPRPLPVPGREPREPAGAADVYDTLCQGFWLLALAPLALSLAALAVLLFLLPPAYESRAVIVPLETKSSKSMLEGLSEPLPFKLELNEQNQGTDIMAFLESRRLKARLIEKHDLLPLLYRGLWDENARAWTNPVDKAPTVTRALQEDVLKGVYEVDHDEDKMLIELFWSGPDPALCQALLASVIDELRTYLVDDYVSQATRERAFLEEQVDVAKSRLREWESRLPEKDLSASAIARELEASRAVYVELRRRLALARVSEAQRRPDFKVLDPPYLPEVWDRLPRYVGAALVYTGSFALVLCLLFARRFIKEIRAERQNTKPAA